MCVWVCVFVYGVCVDAMAYYTDAGGGAPLQKRGRWDFRPLSHSYLPHNINKHTGGSYRRDPPPQPPHVQAAAAALAGMSMGKKEVGVDVCCMFGVGISWMTRVDLSARPNHNHPTHTQHTNPNTKRWASSTCAMSAGSSRASIASRRAARR